MYGQFRRINIIHFKHNKYTQNIKLLLDLTIIMQLKENFKSGTNNPYNCDSPIIDKSNGWNQFHNNSGYPTMMQDVSPDPQYNSNQQRAYQLQLGNQQHVFMQEVIIQQKPYDGLSHLNDGSLQGSARKNFIKKVYLILGMQLLITAAMCFASYYSIHFLEFQIKNYWLMYVSIAFMIVTEVLILCCPTGRQYPANLILLLVFTMAESYLVSFTTSVVAHAEGGAIVVIAACMTLFIVFCLTMYAIFTPNDFTTPFALLIAFFASIIMFGVFAWTSWIPILHTLYCTLGCILFSFYLVIDTQSIVGGRRYELSMDDYVAGALLLYIDIIQIFIYLLSILGNN